MKKIVFKTVFPFFALGLFSRASDILSADCPSDCPLDETDVSDFHDKCWYLDEVKIGKTIISINRKNKPESSYTIMFNTERFAGIGAPNHFFGLYSAKKNYTLFFNKINSTRMLPIFEMYDIKEHEYFLYIERATRWKIRKGKLELYSSKEDGTQVVLAYSTGRE
ncbi:META domain-containing protein [Treponema sp. R80B11-R83G3]